MKTISQLRFAPALAAAAIVAAFALAGALYTQPAYAVSAAELQAEAQAVLDELSAMQVTLDEASDRYFACLQEYQAAAEKRDAAQQEVDKLTAEIGEIQDRLGGRAREMYRNGSSTFVDLLLGATTFEEFAQSWDMLNRLNEDDATLSARARDLRAQAEEKKAEYGQQAAIADEKSKEAGEAMEEAAALVEQMQATYDSLSAEAQELYAAEQAAAYAAPTEGGYINDDGTVTDIQTGQVYASAYEYTSATGNAVVDRARAMIGSNYVWGGVGGSDGGFDCSGLVSYALTGSNTRLGNTTTFMGWNQTSNPQVGDVAVNSYHTGIVSRIDPDGTVWVVHAINESQGVQETPLAPYGDYMFVTY